MRDTSRPDAATPLDEPSLGLPRPAVHGLAGAGVTTLAAAWAKSDAELLACHGVGAKAVRTIRQLQGGGGASAIADYLDRLPPEQKAAFQRVHDVVIGTVPEVEEGTSYGMPAFLYAGRPLLGFRAAKQHLSVFPFSPAAIEAVKDRLDGFELAKGTIRFSPERPVPDDVLADLVRLRREEIAP
jgi:uncharacterized protein YdhG (YjbR/CyaY superfamily)